MSVKLRDEEDTETIKIETSSFVEGDLTFAFTTPSNSEFTGFSMTDANGDCQTTALDVLYRTDCAQTNCISLDLSNISGQ